MKSYEEGTGNSVEVAGVSIHLDLESRCYDFSVRGIVWKQRRDHAPYFVKAGKRVLFSQAAQISDEIFQSGVGVGIRSVYRFSSSGEEDLRLVTRVWVEESCKRVHCEWVALSASSTHPDKVYWPAPMDFRGGDHHWQSLIPLRQGLLLPNGWPTAFGPLPFAGRFYTADAYLPLFGQIRGKEAYLAISRTPENAGYYAVHDPGAKDTVLGQWMDPSLGSMADRRMLTFVFFENADYTRMAKYYRRLAKEEGRLRTLREKELETPKLRQLIGSSFLHWGIKNRVQKDSRLYDEKNPEKNAGLVTFRERAEEIQTIKEAGAGRLYLHLDGWAQPGYDNRHPDYGPICEEAGGVEGMQALLETLHERGDLFGVHDQYRDYYFAAPSFDPFYACRLEDGSIPQHANWAGGRQSYLCASQTLSYVRRNFRRLLEKLPDLDAAYLDVFTCNEGDECFQPEHAMTRWDCLQARASCFRYLSARGLLPSSEEVNDWAVPSQVFCHYAPYDFMLREPGTPRWGLPIPLFNLVYHDCVIEPWMMEKIDREDLMLYALLNGGAPYLIRNGAYAGIDGDFGEGDGFSFAEKVARSRLVADFHEKVADRELIAHHLLSDDGQIQESLFAGGYRVLVDFSQGSYQITKDGQPLQSNKGVNHGRNQQ